MATTKNQVCNWLLIFALVLTPFLHAQDSEKSRNETVKTGEGFQIYQILSFPAVPDVLRYEVEIERLEGRGSVPVERIETTENRVRVSLKVGNYRYRFTAYNKMNRVEGRSEWQNFRVIPVVEPSAESYQPYYGLFFELKDPEGILVVTGKGFLTQTEFALVDVSSNYDWTGVDLKGHRNVHIPSLVEIDGNQARLKFARNTLRKGDYQIFMRNPGGLWTCFGKVHVGNYSNAGFIFSFAWSPMIALFDYKSAVAMDRPEGYWDNQNGIWVTPGASEGAERLDLFNPWGFNFRLAWIFRYTRTGNFGLEFQLYSLIDKEIQRKWDDEGKGSILDGIHGGTFNFLFQLPVAERWQHNIRIGMGAGQAYLFDPYDSEYGTYDYYSPTDIFFDLGYSAQFFLWKNLYLEAGLDLQFGLGYKRAQNTVMLRPTLGMGWQMGRWADYSEVAERAKRGEDHSVPVTEPPAAEVPFSVRWLPMIPLFGYNLYETIDEGYSSYSGEQHQLLQAFNPGGVSAFIAVLPYRWGNNKLGFGFEFSLLDHKNRNTVEVSGFDLINHAIFGMYYQRAISENWQIGVHAGAGLSNANSYSVHRVEIYNTSPIRANGNGLSFATDFGVSAQYFFWRNAYLEAGLDLDLLWNSGKTRGALRPVIGIGWQANRNNETGLRLPGPGLPLPRVRE